MKTKKSINLIIYIFFAFKLYKNLVSSIINSKPTTIEDDINQRHSMLKASMQLLQKLHKINLEFREIVTYDTFYISELIEKIDIKKDYIEWLRRRSLRVIFIYF